MEGGHKTGTPKQWDGEEGSKGSQTGAWAGVRGQGFEIHANELEFIRGLPVCAKLTSKLN
jgi:hypothetical protein